MINESVFEQRSFQAASVFWIIVRALLGKGKSIKQKKSIVKATEQVTQSEQCSL